MLAGRNVLRRRLSTCSSVGPSLPLCVCLSVCLSVHLFVVRQRLKPVLHDIVSRGDWVDFIAESESSGCEKDQEC